MPHDRVVIKDARSTILTWKNAALVGQINPRRIDQIDDRHAITHGDLLSTEDLLDRFGVPRTGFDSGVVGHDDAFAVAYFSNNRYYSRSGSLSVVLIVGD